jgi:hypothetical protein
MNLTDTKILLSNYPKFQQQVPFQKVGSDETLEILYGYDIKVDNHQVTLQIINDLIIAILTYDHVYMLGNNIWDVLSVFGSKNLGKLLRANILHFIPDNMLSPVMMKMHNGVWRPDFFGYPSGVSDGKGGSAFQAVQEEWGKIETIFYKKGINGKEVQAFLYLVDEHKKVLDQKQISELANKETYNDLKNEPFVTENSILRKNNLGLTEFHQLNILRLHELNTVAITAGLLGADAIKTDGKISDLMKQKFASAFSQKLKDGVESIQSVLRKKGFPDLGELFYSNIIDLDDILKLRDSLQGKIFRFWAMHDDYNETQMQMDIMNSVHTVLGSKISGVIRFVTCNAIGLFSPVLGVGASAFDSFILNKVVQGWHPNFFLDDKMKERIDKCIKEKEKEEKEALLRQRFKGIGRNNPCPCGSGKKFKNCHGKV